MFNFGQVQQRNGKDEAVVISPRDGACVGSRNFTNSVPIIGSEATVHALLVHKVGDSDRPL